MSLLALARLALWLGPWSGRPAPPVERDELEIGPSAPGDRPMKAWVLGPEGRRPDGALLLLPGLHPDGPADPRMARFASVLAHAGLLVLTPFLPDFCALKLDPRLMRDADRAFAALLDHPGRPAVKPGVMSISFGGLPALRLAGDDQRAAQIGGVLTFGAYARWDAALRFALSGGDGIAHDPLNRPAVFLNLLDGMPQVVDRTRLVAAWKGFVAETWGRVEMKVDAAWMPVAERWAAEVDPGDVELCRRCFGLIPGAEALADDALARHRPDWLDPRDALAGLSAPLHVVHGLDDDVIPHTEARVLVDACPPGASVKLWLTGAYGHTGPSGGLWSQVRSMVGIMRALRSIAVVPEAATD